jgi:hypothetical protein
MPVNSDLDRLRDEFTSILKWVEYNRSNAKTPSEVNFFTAVDRYAKDSMRHIEARPSRREIRKLRERAIKLQSAVIFYVQRQFR